MRGEGGVRGRGGRGESESGMKSGEGKEVGRKW